jgi:Zn-dependent protease
MDNNNISNDSNQYPRDIDGNAYRSPEPTTWQKLKKLMVPIGAVLLITLKFGAKLKFLVLPVLKFLPLILKTGGTMVLSLWFYAINWGWRFALGFTILILVHECGHLLAAKRVGLKVGAPVFIPFMGAFIALKDAPRNAWIEAQVAMGGPLLGGIGALACLAIYFISGQPIFAALAYVGFMLNLFNLAPIGILDGGRIVSALSLWFWLAGFAVMAVLIAGHPNFILFFIIIFSLPYMWTQFKNRKSAFFAVSRTQRWIIAILYFGLVAVMAAGMAVSHVPPPVGKT